LFKKSLELAVNAWDCSGASNLNIDFKTSIIMPRVIHFEIVADKPERAMKFYKEVFAWDFNKWNGPQDYWLVKTGEDSQPGINGGLTPKMNQ